MNADAEHNPSQNGAGQQCNPVTNRRRVGGRVRLSIDLSDFADTPTEAMRILAQLKNEGHSWRTLADEINDRIEDGRVSHSLVRRVALGECKSPRIDYALGIRQVPPPVEVTPCLECGKIHKTRKACKPSRKRGKHKMVFELDDAEFEHVRAFVGRYPKGRRAWILEKTGWEP